MWGNPQLIEGALGVLLRSPSGRSWGPRPDQGRKAAAGRARQGHSNLARPRAGFASLLRGGRERGCVVSLPRGSVGGCSRAVTRAQGGLEVAAPVMKLLARLAKNLRVEVHDAVVQARAGQEVPETLCVLERGRPTPKMTARSWPPFAPEGSEAVAGALPAPARWVR